MFAGSRSIFIGCATGLIVASLPFSSHAQSVDTALPASLGPQIAAQDLPEASAPQITIAASEIPPALTSQEPVASASAKQTDASQTSPGQTSSSQPASSTQAEPAQADSEELKQKEAEEQLKQEEHQRVLGIMPSFNISYLGAATVSLTAKQKISLAFHSVTDPFAFVLPFVVAGEHEFAHDNIGFPWGIKGLGERAGAAYLDSFDGNMLGNGILPALLHQDPRYYRLGHGSTTHRMLYSLFTNVAARHDNTGKWQPNYSNIGGNIIGGAISNLYYPDTNSGIGLTISNGVVVTAEGALGSIFEEFWPDISRKFLHRDPTHGLDAQGHAADKANQQAPPNAK